MVEEASFGRRVHRQRLRLGITQAELGRRVSHTQGWVSKVEHGGLTPDRVGLINELYCNWKYFLSAIVKIQYRTDRFNYQGFC